MKRSQYATLGALALFVAACAKPLTKHECQALLDRYAEQLLADEQPAAPPAAVHSAQAAAQAAAENPIFEFSACSEEVSRSQYECAMQALDVNAIERCLVL